MKIGGDDRLWRAVLWAQVWQKSLLCDCHTAIALLVNVQGKGRCREFTLFILSTLLAILHIASYSSFTFWLSQCISKLLELMIFLSEFELMHVDEFIDELLHSERVCDIILPRLQVRDKGLITGSPFSLLKQADKYMHNKPLKLMDSRDLLNKESSCLWKRIGSERKADNSKGRALKVNN